MTKNFSGAINVVPNGNGVHAILAPAGSVGGSASGVPLSVEQFESLLHKCGVKQTVMVPDVVFVQDVPASVLAGFGFPGW